MRIIKQLLFIAGMLGLLGIYIRDYIDEAMIDEGYSLNNESELLYADELSAMVDINFSRLNKDEEVLSATDATYLLVYKEGSWLLKAGFINSNLSLGK